MNPTASSHAEACLGAGSRPSEDWILAQLGDVVFFTQLFRLLASILCFDAMLLKSCDAPDGPLPWNHPCLAPAPLPASLLEHALGDAPGVQAEVPAAASWTLDWAVLGWLAFLLACVIILILIKERRAQKRITSRWVRRSIRLAARAGEFEEAFTDIHDKRCEEIFKQQERVDALECGQTMLLDSSFVSSTFEEGPAERSYMTMAARMDLQLDESCEPFLQSEHGEAWYGGGCLHACAKLSVAGAAASPVGHRWFPTCLLLLQVKGQRLTAEVPCWRGKILARARLPALPTHNGVVERLHARCQEGAAVIP